MEALKKIIPLALCGALALAPKLFANPLELKFFPELPLYRSTIADSNILKTEVSIPNGLEKEALNQPIKDLIPYTSLSKEIAILSFGIKNEKIPGIIPTEKVAEANIRSIIEKTEISDEIFLTSLILNGGLKFSENKKPEYDARVELFLGSPVIDEYFSDGNKSFLSVGMDYKGSLDLEGITEKSISSLFRIFNPESRNFFGDFYIVAKSPYSDQFVIVKTGFENLFGDGKSDFDLSATFELPSLISLIKESKDAKIIPYVSAGLKIPLESLTVKESGELGIKITGKSKKSIIGYLKGEYEQGKGGSYCTGLRLDL